MALELLWGSITDREDFLAKTVIQDGFESTSSRLGGSICG